MVRSEKISERGSLIKYLNASARKIRMIKGLLEASVAHI